MLFNWIQLVVFFSTFYQCFVLHAVSSCLIKSDILEKVLAQVLQLYFLISECVCR